MKALTIWQPWAGLIMAGCKPYEFRSWDYRTLHRSLEGQRIAIHAGARPMKLQELRDIRDRLASGESALAQPQAGELLDRLLAAWDGPRPLPGMTHSAILGTARLGTPFDARERFQRHFRSGGLDSDRLADKPLWAWPLEDVRAFREPWFTKGAQGFWNVPEDVMRRLEVDALVAGGLVSQISPAPEAAIPSSGHPVPWFPVGRS